ncbi:MAG TPA: DUF488 domain-containing protein [Candidatus Kryptonia bacterium]|nr:DUF488 domain-containing protein [Candidatus Kryptonia bacterium]
MSRIAVPLTLYTVGHSNRSLDEFLALVSAHDVRCLADVRAFPSSRRWPHFNREPLAAALQSQGIRYQWLPALGGRRHATVGVVSPHTAWTVAAFRHYADYLDTEEGGRGIDRLLALAGESRTAFMCAEALYWQCHRRLIADRLVVLGHRVLHIQTCDRTAEHRLAEFARVVDGRIVYDRATQLPLI